uniref:ankyrin repeat and SOCS box protein 7-like isoform X2 n=1 Tax=Myxine glutinosa TaxID=7769 RepID=UPI00358F8F19
MPLGTRSCGETENPRTQAGPTKEGQPVITAMGGRLRARAAVMCDDAVSLRGLLDRGALPLDARDHKGWTLLHMAASRGSLACIRLLLQLGVDAKEQESKSGFSPLHYAAMNGGTAAARLLIETVKGYSPREGAELAMAELVEARSFEGWTPLHVAAGCGHLSVQRLLLDLKAQVDGLTAQGVTPMVLAALRERPACVRALLEAGADVNAQQGAALFSTALRGSQELCRLLLQRGADPTLARPGDGQTALHMAALRDDLECVRLLHRYGANGAQGNTAGVTPLLVALRRSSSSRPCLAFLRNVAAAPFAGYLPASNPTDRWTAASSAPLRTAFTT